jgi:ribosomal-protein-alanine N-acetyltransferase
MKLVEIEQFGATPGFAGSIPEVARSAIGSTVQLYCRVGWVRPWVGYLAIEEGECVGTCAFTRAPRDNTVEIAYFTFPGNEGRGVATRMGASLVSMAAKEAPSVAVTAHTLPGEGASTRVLRKLGFVFDGPRIHEEDGPIWVWRHQGQGARPPPPSDPATPPARQEPGPG